MLAVISDLHFTDGTTAVNVPIEAFTEVLFPRLLTAVSRCNATELHLVLLGDIFDLVRSDYWLRQPPPDRPWNGSLGPANALNPVPAVEQGYLAVLNGIMATSTGDGFIKAVRQLAANAPNFRLTYVVGNHDRPFHNFPSLRDALAARLAPAVTLLFKSEVRESPYGVLCRHGCEWDENCYGYEFARSVLKLRPASRFDPLCCEIQCIGEVVTAELMSGIVFRARESGALSPQLLNLIMDVNNVRPALASLDWLAWMGSGALNAVQKAAVFNALVKSLGALLDTDLAKKWDNLRADVIVRSDLVDQLQHVYSMIKAESFDAMRHSLKIISALSNLFGPGRDAYAQGAAEDFHSDPDLQFVIYGHTHEAEQVCFEGQTSGLSRRYFNTGTYLPFVERARVSGFAGAKQMTMTMLYNAQEDGSQEGTKRPETVSGEYWTGTKHKLYT